MLKSKWLCVVLGLFCLVTGNLVAQENGEDTDVLGIEESLQIDDTMPPGGTEVPLPDSENIVIIRLHGLKLEAYQIDPERKVVPPDYTRIVLHRMQRGSTSIEEVLVMTKSPDGPFLASPRDVPPPYTFWLRVVLTEGEGLTESRTIGIHPFKP